jgi:hypothetical protein
MAAPLYLAASAASKSGKPSSRSPGREVITTAAATVTSAPEIQSVGPPHALHADRIIGLMMQRMAKQHAELWAAVDAILKDPYCRDGNPRAQAKLEAKIKNLGAWGTILIPGKRGRYALHVYSLAGWDPQRDALIKPGDPIPAKPWICTVFQAIHGAGQGRVRRASFMWLFVTHHSLSRSAQRWGVRTVEDLSTVIEKIIRVALEYLTNRGLADAMTGDGGDARFDTPPQGVRLPMPGSAELGDEGVIVVEKHETRQALVVSTVLEHEENHHG